jgi:hypothetical protein
MSLRECVSWREFDIFPFCFVLFNGLPHPPPNPFKAEHTLNLYCNSFGLNAKQTNINHWISRINLYHPFDFYSFIGITWRQGKEIWTIGLRILIGDHLIKNWVAC